MERRSFLAAVGAVVLFPSRLLRPEQPWIVHSAHWQTFMTWDDGEDWYPTHEPSCEYCGEGWYGIFSERADDPQRESKGDPFEFDWHLDEDGAEVCPNCARMSRAQRDREYPL